MQQTYTLAKYAHFKINIIAKTTIIVIIKNTQNVRSFKTRRTECI